MPRSWGFLAKSLFAKWEEDSRWLFSGEKLMLIFYDAAGFKKIGGA
jgi:hypothetical protein